jgi:hypothetical protein
LNPELGDGEIGVFLGVVEVDQADGAGGFLAADRVVIFDDNAGANEFVECLVGGDRGEGGAAIHDAAHDFIDRGGGDFGVEALDGGLEPIGEDDVAFVGAVGAIVEVFGFGGVAVEQLVAVVIAELLENSLFDVVFGDEVRHGKIRRDRS